MSDLSDDLISVGADILNNEIGMGPEIRGFDAWKTAEKMYLAMRALESKSAQRQTSMTLKLDTSELEKVVSEFHKTVSEFIIACQSLPTEDEEG